MTDEQKRVLAMQMCMTWRHDFPLLGEGEREALIRAMLQLIEHHWPIEKINATAA